MAAHPDAVHELPGWDGPLPSANFSGFIDVVRDGKAAKWHYTLTEAEAPLVPEDAPLVLYVSGGPGGSSFQTSFRGFGQFRLDDRSVEGEAFESTGVPQLLHHEYGWTKAANVLSWESPPGVGFSFCPDPADAVWDDATVAEHSADFLEGVVERHPSYRGRTFVVLGASYAGVYIPMLAKAILARGSGAKNASLLRHFVLDMIILPRQARDKRRESSQKQRCVSRSVPAAPHSHRRRQRGDRPLSRLELPRRRPGKKTRAFVRHFQ